MGCHLIFIKAAKLCVYLCVCLQLSAINVGKRFQLGDYLFRESVVGTSRKKIEWKLESFKISGREVGVISSFN
jgi:hypothetical protein